MSYELVELACRNKMEAWWWIDGMLECWSVGVLDFWSIGVVGVNIRNTDCYNCYFDDPENSGDEKSPYERVQN